MPSQVLDEGAPAFAYHVLAPSHEEIASRAYQRYLERGSSDGQDLDDWLEAERELLNEHIAGVATQAG